MASDWGQYSLGELCEFRGGAVFKPHLQGNASGEIPFVKVSDMNLPSNTVRILEANNWVSSSQLKELKAKPLPPGAVVFAKIGEALRQNRLRQIVRDTIVDNNMMGAVPREEKVDPRFFYYALSQFDFSRIAQGTALPYLTITSLSALSLEVPALPEQRAIAHILGALDDKFELNRRMNETLEAIAQAIFKSWFVDFDPVRAKASGEAPESICRRLGLTPDLLALFPDRLVDSELGEIPEGWKIGTLGTVAEHQRRGIQPAEIAAATPYIALEHMPRRCIALSDWDMADGLESNKFQFRKGEILFGKLRPYFHKVGVAPVDGVCSTDIVVVTPKGDGWFGFVLGHVSSDAFVEHTNAGSTGTKMPRTSWNDMARFQIVIPFDAISDAFTSLVQPMVDRIVASIYEGRTLAGLRDALLPQLLSGELRLSAEGAK